LVNSKLINFSTKTVGVFKISGISSKWDYYRTTVNGEGYGVVKYSYGSEVTTNKITLSTKRAAYIGLIVRPNGSHTVRQG
jgi:hypothetical protein